MCKFKERTAHGERIRGGFIIFRRSEPIGRIAFNPKLGVPFEHPTFEAAEKEMKRLAELEKGKEFCVFYQVTSLKK